MIAQLKKVHLFACKKFLNVPVRTPSFIVHGELVCYQSLVKFCIKTIKLWLRLMLMNTDYVPKQAYKLLYSLDSQGKKKWVTKVQVMLGYTGFNHVWLN